MKNVTVNDYKSGNQIGVAEMTDGEWQQYIREMQMPQQICRADVLCPEERVRLGLRDDQTIWMEEVE